MSQESVGETNPEIAGQRSDEEHPSMHRECLSAMASEDAPEVLEALYRSDRSGFVSVLPQLLAERPGDVLLRAWNARLTPEAGITMGHVVLVTILGVLAGLFIKLPGLFGGAETGFFAESWFYPRNLSLGPLGAVLLYFWLRGEWKRPVTWLAPGLLLLVGVFLNMLPDTDADSSTLAFLHGPLLLWCAVGLAFAQGRFTVAWCKEYIRFFGEVVVFSGLLFLGGGVLVLLTYGLFELLNAPAEWVYEWMAPMGWSAIPVVAAAAVLNRDRDSRIMPILARIFVPLFLVVLMAYLVRMVAHLSALFQDREALLIYNVLLITVLGLAVFSIAGRQEKSGHAGFLEWLLAGLIGLTVLLDLVGLAAIGQRLWDMGITPNRMAVLGANLFMFGNLAWLLSGYLRLLHGRSDHAALERITARCLPLYAGWTALVTFLFPLIW